MMFVYGTGISFEELNPRNSYRVSLAREKGERKAQSPKVDGLERKVGLGFAEQVS